MVDEIAEEIDSIPSMIITCCGGGGLLCGLVEGMRRYGWTSVPVLAMETIGAESLNAAVKAGGIPVRIPGITSIATCLGSVIICDQLAQDYRRSEPPILSHLVSDRDAVDACLKFANHHNMLVETACGAALASLYTGLVRKLFEQNSDLYGDGPVIVIICGGCSINIDMLNDLKKRFNL
jgi:L-serine/L-threonine ammonia-lyase